MCDGSSDRAALVQVQDPHGAEGCSTARFFSTRSIPSAHRSSGSTSALACSRAPAELRRSNGAGRRSGATAHSPPHRSTVDGTCDGRGGTPVPCGAQPSPRRRPRGPLVLQQTFQHIDRAVERRPPGTVHRLAVPSAIGSCSLRSLSTTAFMSWPKYEPNATARLGLSGDERLAAVPLRVLADQGHRAASLVTCGVQPHVPQTTTTCWRWRSTRGSTCRHPLTV